MCSDEDHEETVTDVMTLNKNNQRIEHLGLTLAEAKQLLSTLQQRLLQQSREKGIFEFFGHTGQLSRMTSCTKFATKPADIQPDGVADHLTRETMMFVWVEAEGVMAAPSGFLDIINSL
jgi:hypothetical protein